MKFKTPEHEFRPNWNFNGCLEQRAQDKPRAKKTSTNKPEMSFDAPVKLKPKRENNVNKEGKKRKKKTTLKGDLDNQLQRFLYLLYIVL